MNEKRFHFISWNVYMTLYGHRCSFDNNKSTLYYFNTMHRISINKFTSGRFLV